jgi:hypothetical protein
LNQRHTKPLLKTMLSQLPKNSALRQALEAILKLLNGQPRHLQLVA